MIYHVLQMMLLDWGDGCNVKEIEVRNVDVRMNIPTTELVSRSTCLELVQLLMAFFSYGIQIVPSLVGGGFPT